jgi:hypothetical protein
MAAAEGKGCCIRLKDYVVILSVHSAITENAMPRISQHPKETSFNLRIDPLLKAAFTAAAEAEDKPAAQILRDFMRAYVKQRERRAFEAEARRQSLLIAERARDPNSDEAQVMREIEIEMNDPAFWDDWKA